jgi:hypothetical protein
MSARPGCPADLSEYLIDFISVLVEGLTGAGFLEAFFAAAAFTAFAI